MPLLWGLESEVMHVKNRMQRLALVGGFLAISGAAALAGTDATAITTAATTAFADIATLCVAIGTFFVVYRLVKRVK